GQNGAFISLGGGIDLADYAKFYQQHSDAVPGSPKKLNIITIDGAKNDFGDPNGADGENSLDAIQMQSVAPKANVSMILGQNTDQSFNNVFVRGIFPQAGEGQNSVVSSSWGAPESGQSTQAINTMSQTFKQGVIRGVQVFSASGDTGAKDGARDYEVDYPSSDPNVTGVGGLKMTLTPSDKVSKADAWNEGTDSSTGGGISKVFKLPTWQAAVNKVLNLDTGKPGRGVPDVSTDADPATGFRVRVDGGEYVIGGTSDAAPLYSGMMLNINSELAAAGIKQVSPLNPWLYARAGTPVFTDVTTGDNNGYKTAKGWDPVTGLGYIDGQNMLDAMKANQTANVGGKGVFTAPGGSDGSDHRKR
ncbi:MAG TPA: S53 family peptidase, partial [Chroococcales cyanobacterium]